MRKLLLILLLVPTATALQISEIMYNVEGSDEGYEWIEVYNDGGDLNLCEYKFYENGQNHRINAESCTIAAGDYVVIADVADNLDFAMFDSSWQSLSNSGEQICLRDSEKNDLDCVIYSSDQGANGDGNSLQLSNGEWCAVEPTPRQPNNCSVSKVVDQAEQTQSRPSNDSQINRSTGSSEQEQPEQEQPLPEIVSDPLKEQRIEELEQKLMDMELRFNITQSEPERQQITGGVVYESKASERSNLPILMLLAVSILLNVFLILYTIRR